LSEKEILDVHFVYDFVEKKITSSLESFDDSYLAFMNNVIQTEGKSMTHEMFVHRTKMMACYVCTLDPYVLIVGKSGSVIIYDKSTGRHRKIDIVPKEDRWPDPNGLNVPKGMVNTAPDILWVSPLAGEETLMARPVKAPNPDKPGEFVWNWIFLTLDMRTGKVTNRGAEYRGQKEAMDGPFIEEYGELITVTKFLEGKGFENELKKLFSTLQQQSPV
jgi:hypothetical protein